MKTILENPLNQQEKAINGLFFIQLKNNNKEQSQLPIKKELHQLVKQLRAKKAS